MSKGTPVICLRVPADLLEEIDAALKRAEGSFGAPPDRTAWLLAAIRERVAKQARGRRRRTARRREETWDQDDRAVPVGWTPNPEVRLL